jgi:endoglucanase
LAASSGRPRAARRQRALLVLVAYYLPDRGCSLSGQGAPSPEAYRRWIDRLVGHLGSTRAAIVVEPDAVAAECFDTRRATLLKRSVRRLADAGQYVYIDAGHARWRSTGEMAQRLLGAGIQYAQGFSVNVANRQTTKQSYRWGRELSDLLGDREFVADTSRNGLGPPRTSRVETTSGATHDARRWAKPPRPGQRQPCRGWPRCSGLSSPANRTASAEARPPTSSLRSKRDG